MNTAIFLNIFNGGNIEMSNDLFVVIIVLGVASIISSIIAIKNELLGKNTICKKIILMTPIAMIALSIMFWVTVTLMVYESLFTKEAKY